MVSRITRYIVQNHVKGDVFKKKISFLVHIWYKNWIKTRTYRRRIYLQKKKNNPKKTRKKKPDIIKTVVKMKLCSRKRCRKTRTL